MKISIREERENLEKEILSPYATLSVNSKGRKKRERKCEIRTEFQRDRDRIIHSKSFRRLKHKTQVFISPEYDHYRTRMTHTLEVTQIARTIARALRLNEDLTEAIALGHDLGHTPFGHVGEEILDRIYKKYSQKLHFKHNEQSLRVVDVLEREGEGLNLTYEVRDGILNHAKGIRDLNEEESGDEPRSSVRGEGEPETLEGKVVRIADRVAYLNHDIADAIRAGIISGEDLPRNCVKILGKSQKERIDVIVKDIIDLSAQADVSLKKPFIKMSKKIIKAMNDLKDFLFEKVYFNPEVRKEDKKIENLLTHLFEYYFENFDKLIQFEKFKNISLEEKVKCIGDYIAGMTDYYVLINYKKIFLPERWKE